jgi:predicted nuclease of predicted toxin-antitoxin system
VEPRGPRGAVIFTKDEDFAFRRLRAQTGPTVVWLRVGNSSNLALQRWLMPLLSEVERMVAAGETLIEAR